MKQIAIVGAGGLGREILLMIHQINQLKPVWAVIGFFDDGLKAGCTVDKTKVIAAIDRLNDWPTELAVVLAIADTAIKSQIAKNINNPFIKFPCLIHPSVVHGELSGDGRGSLICANSSLTTHITIGRHVIINLNCTVGHDTVIEDFCSIMPGSNISGKVKLKEGAYIGTGAQLLQDVTIGPYATVGAGAVGTKDVAPGEVVVGVPAKRIS